MNTSIANLDKLAAKAILDSINLFEFYFPNATNEDFKNYYICIVKQIQNDLFRWIKEDEKCGGAV